MPRRVNLLVLCLMGLIIGSAWGEGVKLKEIEVGELIELVNKGQAKYKRMNIEYKIVYGFSDDVATMKESFVAQEPAYEVDMNFNCDRKTGRYFIEEDMLTKDGRHFMSAISTDGSTYRRLAMDKPNGKQWFGVIGQAPHRSFTRGFVSQWRPTDLVLGPVKATNRAKLLKDSELVEIERVKYEGNDAYKVWMRVKDEKSIMFQGKSAKTVSYEDYCTWYVPAYGMMVVREEKYHIDSRTQERHEKIHSVMVIDDIEKKSWKLWWPNKVYMMFNYGKKKKVYRVEMKNVKIGDSVQVRGDLKFPIGTHVTDEVIMKKFKVK
ncbi:hypothetical protein JD969_08960 [Planctomycetota bacterium]|nr:hypothetical protein JD969_08960 [Planctomycetota bacterium]